MKGGKREGAGRRPVGASARSVPKQIDTLLR